MWIKMLYRFCDQTLKINQIYRLISECEVNFQLKRFQLPNNINLLFFLHKHFTPGRQLVKLFLRSSLSTIGRHSGHCFHMVGNHQPGKTFAFALIDDIFFLGLLAVADLSSLLLSLPSIPLSLRDTTQDIRTQAPRNVGNAVFQGGCLH